MIQIVADNIISPLGFTTTSNVEALRGGKSALKKCSRFYSPTGEDVVASVIDDAPVMITLKTGSKTMSYVMVALGALSIVGFGIIGIKKIVMPSGT